MNNDEMVKIVFELQGLSFNDWIIIEHSINEIFRKKEEEYKKTLTLSDKNLIIASVKTIRSQFGQSMD